MSSSNLLITEARPGCDFPILLGVQPQSSLPILGLRFLYLLDMLSDIANHVLRIPEMTLSHTKHSLRSIDPARARPAILLCPDGLCASELPDMT